MVRTVRRQVELRPGGGPIRRTNSRRRPWLPAIGEAGLDGLRFHGLRHTQAAALIALGEHPRVISERLGHSSITVTMDRYGHLMPGLDADADDRLDAGWSATQAESRTTPGDRYRSDIRNPL